MREREFGEREKARLNKPWRRWLRRHTWPLTARGRRRHRLIGALEKARVTDRTRGPW